MLSLTMPFTATCLGPRTEAARILAERRKERLVTKRDIKRLMDKTKSDFGKLREKALQMGTTQTPEGETVVDPAFKELAESYDDFYEDQIEKKLKNFEEAQKKDVEEIEKIMRQQGLAKPLAGARKAELNRKQAEEKRTFLKKLIRGAKDYLKAQNNFLDTLDPKKHDAELDQLIQQSISKEPPEEEEPEPAKIAKPAEEVEEPVEEEPEVEEADTWEKLKGIASKINRKLLPIVTQLEKADKQEYFEKAKSMFEEAQVLTRKYKRWDFNRRRGVVKPTDVHEKVDALDKKVDRVIEKAKAKLK